MIDKFTMRQSDAYKFNSYKQWVSIFYVTDVHYKKVKDIKYP